MHHRRASSILRWMTSGVRAEPATGLFDKIAFIGTGKMAQAMIDPLITNGYQPAEKVCVYDVSTKSMEKMKSVYPDIQTSESIGEAVHDAECIVLAVKPQNINVSFWNQFPSLESDSDKGGSGFRVRKDATLLSILAGTPVKDFAPSGISKIVRGWVIENAATIPCSLVLGYYHSMFACLNIVVLSYDFTRVACQIRLQ